MLSAFMRAFPGFIRQLGSPGSIFTIMVNRVGNWLPDNPIVLRKWVNKKAQVIFL